MACFFAGEKTFSPYMKWGHDARCYTGGSTSSPCPKPTGHIGYCNKLAPHVGRDRHILPRLFPSMSTCTVLNSKMRSHLYGTWTTLYLLVVGWYTKLYASCHSSPLPFSAFLYRFLFKVFIFLNTQKNLIRQLFQNHELFCKFAKRLRSFLLKFLNFLHSNMWPPSLKIMNFLQIHVTHKLFEKSWFFKILEVFEIHKLSNL